MMRVDRGGKGGRGKFLRLGFHQIFSINVAIGWFIGLFFLLARAKLTSLLSKWLKIPISYIYNRKLRSGNGLSVCLFRRFGNNNHGQSEIGDLFRIKKENEDMHRLWTFPRNQSWWVTSLLDGCCKRVLPQDGRARKFVEREMSRFRGMLQASLNATKKALTWNVEDLVPPTERFIFNFNSKDELKKWHLYSDSEYGGLSSASLEVPDNENGPTGIFLGNLSLDFIEGAKLKINRSGFCGMRSKKFDGYIDLDPYDTIALKVKGDGRCYISTIYTENWVNSPGQEEDNSWQAFVFVPKDNWYIAKIPLALYLPTWRGNVIDAEMEMNPSRVVAMSLSVNAEGGLPGARTGAGDFKLEIDWIKALRT